MKKYNLSEIMTRAHQIRKESAANAEANRKALSKIKGISPARLAKFLPISISEALKQAWASAKRDAQFVAPTDAERLFQLRMKDRWNREDFELEAELMRRVAVA